MTERTARGATGFKTLFIVLTVLTLFIITTQEYTGATPGDVNVVALYISYILFALVFMFARPSASSIFPSFDRMAPLLIAPIMAHMFNNAVIQATVELKLDVIYPLILVGIFVLIFYKLFKRTIKKSILLTSIGVGLGLGFLLTSQVFIGALGVPTLYASKIAFGVFLSGILIAITEETVFRGILFPMIYRSTKHEEAQVALLLGVGAIMIFMTELQWVGWLMVGLGFIEFLNRDKQLIARFNTLRLGVAVLATSAIFAIFHYRVAVIKAEAGLISSPEVSLFSAFMFSMIVCSFMIWQSKGKL